MPAADLPSQSSIAQESNNSAVKNQSLIVDSSRPGFQSQYTKKIDTKTNGINVSAEQAKAIVETAQSMKRYEREATSEAKTTRVTAQDEREAAKGFKILLQSGLKQFKAQDFHNHNMLFFRYDAKDKEKTYDKTPLILVLRRSKGYVLGLNLHWTPVPLRLIIVKTVMKMNRDNIRRGLPLTITYKMLKPLIQRLNLGPVIRLYIFGRISSRGLVVPHEFWEQAARLRAESFSGGYSADALYTQAIKAAKAGKQTAIKRKIQVYK